MMVARIDPLTSTSSLRNIDNSKPVHVVQIGGKTGIQLFDRVDVPTEDFVLNSNSGIVVAKSDAMPKNFFVPPQNLVWTSGIATWYTLASRGIWVNGTFDSLGENEEMGTDLIAPKTTDWIKFTHTQAAATEDSSIGTYTLVPKASMLPGDLESINRGTHFYFSSGSAFARLIELVPSLKSEFESGNRIIACGPGNSLKLLKSQIGPNVHVAYNFSDFKRQIAEVYQE
jgi:hydroxymethylbilane synthase